MFYSSVQKKFRRNRFVSYSPFSKQCIDLAFLPSQCKSYPQNKGFIGFLIGIDVNTRVARAYEIKSKTKGEIIEVIKKFVTDVEKHGKINFIFSDRESAVKSDAVQAYLTSKRIKWSTLSSGHAFPAERGE